MTESQSTIDIVPPPHLETPPPTPIPPHHPEPLRPPADLVQAAQNVTLPPQDSEQVPDQSHVPPQDSVQITPPVAQTPDQPTTPTPTPDAQPLQTVPSRPRDISELDNLLMLVEAGNLGGPPRKLSVAVPTEGYGNGQSSPVPLPPPLPPLHKMPSGSPKLQRTFTAEKALTPPDSKSKRLSNFFGKLSPLHGHVRITDDPNAERPPSPAHNTMAEIQFSALKRDIKKGKGNFLHRLTVYGKSPTNPPQQPSTTLAPPSQPPPASLSPNQPVPISKKKERQSFMFGKAAQAPFTIPIKISCVSADADGSSSKLVWEIDVQVGAKTKVSELWEWIKQSGASEVSETHAICKDDEILSEKEYLNKYKLKQNDVLKVRPRTKKVVKKQLNNLIARRPSRDELISKNIIATKTAEATVDSVPDVETIQRCVEFLVSTEAYKQEGLFRISAGAMNAKTFYETFRKHEPDFTMIESCHTVAGAIKQYFRGLPAGLIPLRVAIPMREAFQKCGDTPDLYKELAELAKQLPKPNLIVIDSVFRLVLKVIENQEVSKMDDRNCSIVFAPNVFAFDTNMDLMAQSQIQTKLVHIFFKHYEEIFGPATSSLHTSPTPAAPV
eukprot:Phypoly_transcript_04968.p1 GENE.Phypoly_transcript_04968~~Phypoly_transcript_04968.p1  ORF type:complete len:610 (+),score=135.31 Phypoly_transcript_04968:108-1937(+)